MNNKSNLIQGNVKLPEFEIEELSDFELINLYAEGFYSGNEIFHYIGKFEGDVKGFSKAPSLNPPKTLREEISNLTGYNLDEFYYLDSYSGYIDTDDLILPIGSSKKEKEMGLTIQLLNSLFYPFNKKIEDDVYSVIIPDKVFSNYANFVNNKLYYQEEYSDDLFNMINHYFRGILHFKSSSFSPEAIFEKYKALEFISFDNNTISFDLKGNNEAVRDYRFLEFFYQMFDFLITCEMIEVFLIDKKSKDLSNEMSSFLSLINERRVSVEELTHKGAKAKAEKMGLDYLFVPLKEEAIPAGTPFSVKIDLKNTKKISNIWTIVPPTPGYSVTRKYIGHNKSFPVMTTGSEPHLLGDEYIKAKFDVDFYNNLLEHYDWEYKDEAIKTFELIEKYPRLKNELIQLGKELETEHD